VKKKKKKKRTEIFFAPNGEASSNPLRDQTEKGKSGFKYMRNRIIQNIKRRGGRGKPHYLFWPYRGHFGCLPNEMSICRGEEGGRGLKPVRLF